MACSWSARALHLGLASRHPVVHFLQLTGVDRLAFGKGLLHLGELFCVGGFQLLLTSLVSACRRRRYRLNVTLNCRRSRGGRRQGKKPERHEQPGVTLPASTSQS